MKCNYTKIYLSKDLEDAKWERIKMENEYREMKRKMKIIEEEKEKRVDGRQRSTDEITKQ